MSFPGPISVSPINSTNDQQIGLRAFQRITAQVISVTGTTAILEVDGHPIVAQLTSADQASVLASQSTAQFIVTDLSSKSVTLKFIKNDPTQPTLIGVISSGPELAERMLESSNIPVTVTNLIMTRSLLKQHLPITQSLLNEMQSALSGLGNWKEADADLAAAMKAANLPVTGQSLALAARRPAQTADALSQLIAALTQSTGQDLPEEILKQLNSNLQTLNSLILTADGESSGLADQLKAAVEAFGRSLENSLLGQIQNPEKSISEKNLTSLLKLHQMLEQFGKQETARSISEFMADIRREQLMNVRSDASQRFEDWAQIGFIIQNAAQKAEEKFSSARLRIAREPNPDKVNPANTRLILQVDVSPTETVEVALSLSGKQIRTSVIVPDPEWLKQAQVELPSLTDSFTNLGYTLKDFKIEVETPRPFSRLQNGTGSIDLMTVNIEI